jgi:hypothetical protein
MYVPHELRALFWDTDLAVFDPTAYPKYTIFRVLEYGDSDAVAWLEQTFTVDQIREVIRSERRMTPKSANFWALVYGIRREDVAALRGESPDLRVA